MATQISHLLDGIVHEETQKHDQGFDLTVEEIYTIKEPGRVDFGGGELEETEIKPHGKEKRNPEDDYAWWNLDEGQYLVSYNESLNADENLLLQTRRELLERGAFHPTLHIKSLPRIPLRVGGGVRIKENARISTLSRTTRR